MSRKNANVFSISFETLFIICNVAQEGSNGFGFLDCGYNYHMTGNKFFFESLDRSVKLEVKLINNEIVEVSGKDTINVITEHGK